MMKNSPLEAVETGMTFYGQILPQVDVRKLVPMWHVFTLGHIVSIDLDRISRRFGLSIADVHLLGTVRIERPRPIRAVDLAATLNVSQAALSTRIDRLAKAGLLHKQRQDGDRRAFVLVLTGEGRRIADASVEAFVKDAHMVRALDQLSEDDRAALTRIVGSLHRELDRVIAAGVPGDA